ncbi:hypothetical protein CERSUDRAFT_111032 [Gelatoporia subvermispora B]|uniref:Uncharacterized protein n=1 Tax=Ceriporiopsis subvermispora (strain B) TaxID=914234 RepID=M2PUN0_CERS8|nr:hypothetical protein CERSUDRAFT_111032 [Gelatoporia subvermispora B]
MGRWTLEHHDDVLLSKVKNLVMGAVKRSKLEKAEPSISYEAFVQDLDEGDSFTTSLVEALVKELADRRIRQNPKDRRISSRTASFLRHQIYRDNLYSTRTASRTRHVFARPDELHSSSGEDEYGTVPEGARVNSELYDAYNASSFDILSSLRSSDPSPLATGTPIDWAETDPEAIVVTSPRPSSPPVLPSFAYRTMHSSAHGSSNVGSSLPRQNSVRRPARSRTVDFNEFTSLRRSSSRQNAEVQDGTEDAADGSWRFDTLDYSARRGESSADRSPHTQPARRFFPFRSVPVVRRRSEVGGSFPWVGELTHTHGPSDTPWSHSASTATPWPTLANTSASTTSPPPNPLRPLSSSEIMSTLLASAPSHTNIAPRSHSRSPSPVLTVRPSSSSLSLLNDRRHTVAPRLRRGGTQPPEAMLPMHVSQSTEMQHAEAQANMAVEPQPTPAVAEHHAEARAMSSQSTSETPEPVPGVV